MVRVWRCSVLDIGVAVVSGCDELAALESHRHRVPPLHPARGAAGSGDHLATWLGVRAEELGQARWLSIDPGEIGSDGEGIPTGSDTASRIDGLDVHRRSHPSRLIWKSWTHRLGGCR